MRARWIAAALCVTSFAGWSSWELLRAARTPLMDLSGRFTDHFSHMNAGRLLLRLGSDLWRKPLVQALPRPTPEQAAKLPKDVSYCSDCLFVVPGWKKPVLSSWPTVVRFYPPGDMLLTAPVAVLYHFTSLSATSANRLLLVLLLASAHLGIFVLIDGFLSAPDGLRWHALLPAYLSINAVLHWTLEGFYDAAVLVPLLLCWRFLGERRALAALVAFCAAAFLHFRAYYYAPWVLASAAMLLRDRQWRTWQARDFAAAGIAALLGGASLTTFALALPGLLSFKDFLSPLYVSATHLDARSLLLGALVGAAALGAFLAARSSIDALMVAWLAVLLATVRQTMPWYIISVVPWLCAVPRAKLAARNALVLDARALVFLFLAVMVHGEWRSGIDVAPAWLAALFL